MIIKMMLRLNWIIRLVARKAKITTDARIKGGDILHGGKMVMVIAMKGIVLRHAERMATSKKRVAKRQGRKTYGRRVIMSLGEVKKNEKN